jgi:hypothetical protein
LSVFYTAIDGDTNPFGMRTATEIEHWIAQTLNSVFWYSIRTTSDGTSISRIVRLPIAQHRYEKVTFVADGFSNLKMAEKPLTGSEERPLLFSLIQELNNLFHLNLGEDFMRDCFLKDNNLG